MLDHEYSRMRPLYEAMFIGSSTLAWLEQSEPERSGFELQESLAHLSRAMEEFIDVASIGEVPNTSELTDLQGSIFLVETVNCMVQLVDGKTREALPRIPRNLQEPIGMLLDQVDALADRIEEILEAWQIAGDEETHARLIQAVSQIDATKTEIPDWRESLECLVSD
jgi:hypothetical protein